MEPEEDEQVQNHRIPSDNKEETKQGGKPRVPLQERHIDAVTGQFVHSSRIATSATPKVLSECLDTFKKK